MIPPPLLSPACLFLGRTGSNGCNIPSRTRAFLLHQPCAILQVVIAEQDSKKGTAKGAVRDLLTEIGEGVAERGTGDLD